MRFLIKKPSASNSNLAECLGMPVSTVEKRVAKLCREQCIERVARISDWVAAGYPLHYWIDLRLNPRDLRARNPNRRPQDLSKQLAIHIMDDLPSRFADKILVEDVVILLGSPADLSVSLRAADHHTVLDFITNGLCSIDGVESTTTFHAVWSTTEGQESSEH